MNAKNKPDEKGKRGDLPKPTISRGDDYEFEIRWVPLPEEQREAYWHAMRILYKYVCIVLSEEGLPICSECGSYLHLRQDGEKVCRNEICPNFR